MVIKLEGIRPTIRDEVINIVESIDNPKFKYLGNDKLFPMTLLFESTAENLDYSLNIVKQTLKKSEIGKTLTFRVMPQDKQVYYPH
jgi:hypothetical protein